MTMQHNPVQPTVAIAHHQQMAHQLRSECFAQLCSQGWQRLITGGLLFSRGLLDLHTVMILGAVALLLSCSPLLSPTATVIIPASAATQITTLSALQQGLYDSDVTFVQLAQTGDVGLGAFDGLDGEMVALDGKFYQAQEAVTLVIPQTARFQTADFTPNQQ